MRALLSLVLFLACLQTLLPATLLSGAFQDENASVECALHLFTHLQYALNPAAPNAGAFEPVMSIGILSNWPVALGWGLGGDLLTARIAAASYDLALAVALGFCFVRTLVPAWRHLALPLALLSVLLVIQIVPGVPQNIVQGLGEFSGAVVLGFGLLLLPAHPRAAALVLGSCVWHTKFIYAPFAGLGLLWSVGHHRADWRARARFLLVQSFLFLAPLLAWMLLVVVRTGTSGFLEWTVRRWSFYQTGHYSALAGEPLVAGLASRLLSPKLDWSGFSTLVRYEILGLLALPCLVLLGQTVARQVSGRRDWNLTLLQGGLSFGLVTFGYWYFYLHHYMWIRHLVPTLLVGAGILLHFGLTRAAHAAPGRQVAIAALVLALALGRSALDLPETWRLLRPPIDTATAPPLFPRKCRADDPWRAGPWKRIVCWQRISPEAMAAQSRAETSRRFRDPRLEPSTPR